MPQLWGLRQSEGDPCHTKCWQVNFGMAYQMIEGKKEYLFSTLLLTIISCDLQEPEFYMLKEDETPCIFGPIEKQRWSYACAKQLIERLIYGK